MAPRELLLPHLVSRLAWVTAAVGAVVLVLGTVVTGSGPHSGDAEQPARTGFDPRSVAWLHADLVMLFVGLVVAVLVAVGYAPNVQRLLTGGPDAASVTTSAERYVESHASHSDNLLVDDSDGRRRKGQYDPATDRYFMIGAAEQRYGTDPQVIIDLEPETVSAFPHFFFNSGFAQVPYTLFTARDQDAYYAPFGLSAATPKVLVVGTTFDPATQITPVPIMSAQGFVVRSMPNAFLLAAPALTMQRRPL